MSKTSLKLSDFKDARARKMAWESIGEAFRAEIRAATAEGGGPAKERLQKSAAITTGYSIGMLRSFAATLDWLDELPKAQRPSKKTIGKSFTALDLVRRIAASNTALALEILQSLDKGKVPVSQIRRAMKGLTPKPVANKQTGLSASMGTAPGPVYGAAPRQSLAQERAWRFEDAFGAIERLLAKSSGSVFRFGKPEGISPIGIRCDAIAWLNEDLTEGDGFEIVHAPHGLGRSVLSDQVSRAVVASRYFRRHYLSFTPDSSPYLIDLTVEALKRLEIGSIGVVWLGEKEPMRFKPLRAPEPNHRHRLRQICPAGRWLTT